MIKKRGILKGLKVPWKLTQAVTGFSLEFMEDDYCHVQANANDIPKTDTNQQLRRVRISFDCPAHVVIHAAIGTETSVDLDLYDTSLLNPSRDGIQDTSKRNEALRGQWIETGCCPNPWAYEVAQSELVKELNILPDYMVSEYLLVGDGYSISIVSKSYTWSWSS